MENYKDINTYLEDNGNQNIEVKSKSIACALVIIIVSALLVIVAATPVIANQVLSMSLIVLGAIAIIYGILKLWSDKTRNKQVFIYQPTNEKMKRMSVYVDSNDMLKVQNCIAKNNYAELSNVKKLMTSGHYIDILGTGSGKCYVLQMLDYVPHQFEPVSEVAVLIDENALIIDNLIKK